MAVYWLLFAYFAVGAIIAGSFRYANEKRPGILFAVGAIIMAALIGLRYKVGGDWVSYQFIYDRAGPLNFADALTIGDPGYQALNWAAYQLGGQVWLVNLISAAIFVWGLFRFCRTQPSPWLAVVVAIPYMVIVIAMGYTRQGVALGILMAGIAAFLRGASPVRFSLYVAIAALFHKTAIVALPVVALATERNRLVNVVIVVAAGVLLYDLLLGNAMDNFVANYIQTGYSSQGAAIRISMNMLAAGLLWFAGKRLQFNKLEFAIWRNFCLASIVSLVFLVISPSSTAVDRLSLYLIPLQLAVFARIPMIFKSRVLGATLVTSYCFIIEFVWLNFGQFSNAWIPYQFFPI